MAESTAGIGEAGALINRAKAPATMDITRGMQMAETSALKKAQLEAAKEAKKQAKMAAMDKYLTFKGDLYKNSSVNEKAKKIGEDFYKKAAIAREYGDVNELIKLKQDFDFIKTDLKIDDNILTSLKPNNKQVDATDMYKAADKGKLPEYLQTASPLIQKYFDQDEQGFPIVNRPNKYNLDKAYDQIVKSLGPDFVDAKEAAFDKIKMTKRVPAEELRKRAVASIINDERLSEALDWNPEFQKVFKEQYENNLEREDEAKVNFVYNNLTKYNEPKYQMSSQSKGGSQNVYSTGFGFKWGKYDVQVNDMPAQDVFNQTYNLKDGTDYVVKNVSEGATNALRKQMSDIVSQDPNAKWKKISLTDVGKLTFVDPDTKKAINDADLVAIYSSGKKHWVQYRYKDNFGFEKIGVSPINTDILTVLNGKMGSGKQGATLKQVVDAFKQEGIDFSSVVGRTVSVGGSTPPPAKGGGGTKKDKITFTGKASNELISLLGADTTNINRNK
jgi:hypothetical protein